MSNLSTTQMPTLHIFSQIFQSQYSHRCRRTWTVFVVPKVLKGFVEFESVQHQHPEVPGLVQFISDYLGRDTCGTSLNNREMPAELCSLDSVSSPCISSGKRTHPTTYIFSKFNMLDLWFSLSLPLFPSFLIEVMCRLLMNNSSSISWYRRQIWSKFLSRNLNDFDLWFLLLMNRS